MIYRYRKFDLPISEIRFTDIGKSADLSISEIQNELPISENRFSDIGKSDDFTISVNQNYLYNSVILFGRHAGISARLQCRGRLSRQ